MKKILNVFGMALFVAFLGMNVYSSLENPLMFVSGEAMAQGIWVTTGECTIYCESGVVDPEDCSCEYFKDPEKCSTYYPECNYIDENRCGLGGYWICDPDLQVPCRLACE